MLLSSRIHNEASLNQSGQKHWCTTTHLSSVFCSGFQQNLESLDPEQTLHMTEQMILVEAQQHFATSPQRGMRLVRVKTPLVE